MKMLERTLIDWMFEYPGYTLAIVVVVTLGITTSVEYICRAISSVKGGKYEQNDWEDDLDRKD